MDDLAQARARIDAALAARLADPAGASDDPGRLREALRYAVLGGGKRLRPLMVLAAARAAGGDEATALPAACAVELLHAYTLVHDDLPAMDDDDERRGRPTVHIAFDEATAILCGDGLLTAAFGALAELGPRAADAVAVLARRAGAQGLLAGQCRDLAALAPGAAPLDLVALERLHAEKTGALFAAAAELGGIAAGASPPVRAALAEFGMAYGIAFQHADDLDDGDQPAHAEAARQRLTHWLAQARAALAPLGAAAAPLAAFADRLVTPPTR